MSSTYSASDFSGRILDILNSSLSSSGDGFGGYYFNDCELDSSTKPYYIVCYPQKKS